MLALVKKKKRKKIEADSEDFIHYKLGANTGQREKRINLEKI